MNVIISAGGKFHAQQLAYQLQKRNALKKLFTFDYTSNLSKNFLDQNLVQLISSCKVINELFLKLRLEKIFNKTSFNNFKDNLFDYIVSKKITTYDSCDIFVGWAHYALQSMHSIKKLGALTILESGSSHIMRQHEILSEEYKQWGIPFAPIHPATLEKMCTEYDEADYIMTLSSFARKSFIDHNIPEHKLITIPCGADIDFFLKQTSPDTNINKKFTVIVVGLVTLRKGIHHIIQAWNQAQFPVHDTELLIIGPLQKDFIHVKQKLTIPSNIQFTGPVDRTTLKKLYHQSSLFVLPSLEDGFGMVLGEAMASGLPTICSNHTAGADLIEDKKHGFIFSAGDIISLRDILIWCYQNPKIINLIGQVAQQHIQSFSWDTYGEKVFSAYIECHNKKLRK